jgi:hypothetical protein
MKVRAGFVSNSSSSSFLLLLPYKVRTNPENLQSVLFDKQETLSLAGRLYERPEGVISTTVATKLIYRNLSLSNQTDELDDFLAAFCQNLPEGNREANQLLWDGVIARAKATQADYYILTLHSDGDEEEALLLALVEDGLLDEFQLLSIEEK